MNKMMIVGAGICGTRAALTLRTLGFDGEIQLIGEEPHLPYDRPPLSKPGATGVVIQCIASQELLDAQSINYLQGQQVTSIDRQSRHVQLTNGSLQPYDRLCLALGATPRKPDIRTEQPVLTLRTRDDANRIDVAVQPGASVVIMGAGLIGLELAAVLRSLDIAVTVIEAGSSALGRGVPNVLARCIQRRHEQAGVAFHFNETITRITADSVELHSGSLLPATVVVAAIGVVPNTALAVDAGLDVDNGVCTNASLFTNDPDILAAGDCAAMLHPRYGRIRLESWRYAQDQGEAAASAMLGEALRFDTIPWFWSDQYELGLQIAGIFNAENTTVTRIVNDQTQFLFELSTDIHLTAAAGLGPGMAVAKDIKLAEKLIEGGKTFTAEELVDPTVNLKSLLRR